MTATDCDSAIAAHWQADHALLDAVIAPLRDRAGGSAYMFDLPMRRFDLMVRGG